jgi:Hypothetical glycosyl hydrolase 6
MAGTRILTALLTQAGADEAVPIKPLRRRQIHLDFHISENISRVGAAFDRKDFVSTLKAAHLDSITVFAKCHHGWSYHPTRVGAPHPGLARPDLLGDIVNALKVADIECPIYISAHWEERNAREHRAVSATNSYHRDMPGDYSSGKALSPAGHTLYQACAGRRLFRA